MEFSTVPTLLIGLGGIGSQVVDLIYGKIPPAMHDRIAVHAFDTNINDIDKCSNLRNVITQTSTNWTVGNYLEIADSSVNEWFPSDVRELKRKLLTDGAGQVRCVSRLAYRASIDDGKLAKLHSQIRDIFQARGDRAMPSVRVMIVTSLGGGTGSGIFLQTAMYVRDILMNEFKKNAVLVRGAFLLPDPLIQSGLLDETHHENVRANAYASLKELNAITINAGIDKSDSGGATIELEYKPRQEDLDGRQSHVVTDDNLPFDFCFLYDFENERGENLKFLDNYINQMVKTIHLQLFSPISGPSFSEEDNFILGLVSENGLNRYCGAGVASLVYPYKKLVRYCALRWTDESFSSEWLRLDKEYDGELEQYERDRQAGVGGERPKLGKRYLSLVDNYAKDNNPDPFFLSIYDAVHIPGERAIDTKPRSELFLGNVDKLIEQIVKDDKDLNYMEQSCVLDNGQMTRGENVISAVEDMEGHLSAYQRQVFVSVRSNKSFIINQTVRSGCEKMVNSDHSLNTWMLNRPYPLHPVAVRYVLYSLEELLEVNLKKVREQVAQVEKNIDNYKKAYNLSNKRDIVETIEDRFRNLENISWFSKLLGRKFKALVIEYKEKSSRQLNGLNLYRQIKLKELVYEELLSCVRDLLRDWKDYFDQLRSIRNGLQKEIRDCSNENERNQDPMNVYVLASAEDKESMWKELRNSVAKSSELPPDFLKKIYEDRYKRFCGNHFGGKRERFSRGINFGEEIVSWCENEIMESGRLSYNVLEALTEEARSRNIDHDTHLKERIAILERLASPFAPEISKGKVQNQEYWGINSKTLDGCSEDWVKDNFGGNSRLVRDDSFPETELIRYTARYGYLASDFTKFKASAPGSSGADGSYHTAYKRRIKRLVAGGDTITPHLDKRWHLPAYMTDLNSVTGAGDLKLSNEAFLLGLAFARFKSRTEGSRSFWECHTVDKEGNEAIKLVYKGGTPVAGGLYDLYEALPHNPGLVYSISDWANAEISKVPFKRTGGEVERSFSSRSVEYSPEKITILDAIASFVNERPAMPEEELEKKTVTLMNILFNLIIRTKEAQNGKTNDAKNKEETIIEINDLLANSSIYSQYLSEGTRLGRNWDVKVKSYQKTLEDIF
ncbi:Tubulin like [Maridesulfovibrio ferrireducens]|uniref:Tubulin like n=1 Tax=Maridesulfovibrio ferrireducens TaxID=246191 RepID=A0A1G9J3K2_9BACT|nr:tubulin-like doman-containing protein [Maridesulfovibrio ferrireducens]SDL31895.1 Tubulin like [Maridesulfovibrio ferrireducens]